MFITEMSMDSSPITIGFPSIPAVMGFVHALQRQLQKKYTGLILSDAGIACHTFEPGIHQTKQGVKISMSKNSFYKRKHCEKKAVPFIEEGKADLEVSIIITLHAENFSSEELQKDVFSTLPYLRFAGGTIWQPEKIKVVSIPWDDDAGQKKVLYQLMPGFVLIERRDLVTQSMNDGKDALDAILDHLEVRKFHANETEGDDDETFWGRKSGVSGWILPISVGYRAISPLGQVVNQRDPDYKHCFAENIITLGEFVMPVRINTLQDIMWHSYVDENQGIYSYVQQLQNKGEY